MRKIFLSLVAILLYTISFSQSRVTIAEYNKTQQPAIENEFPFPQSTVSDAVKDKIEKMGYKGKDSKGYTIYKAVKVPEIGPETYDLYLKTDRKSKKEKDISVVTLLITKGNENFVSGANDTALIGNAKRYLENLRPVVEAHDLDLQIAEQESAVKKSDKKLSGLADDGTDLVKKQAKIADQIAANLKDQENQKADLEKQKQILETLKGKKKQ